MKTASTSALLERVSTLIRVNLSEMIDLAEDPTELIKQAILDMENLLLHVKTALAIAIADQHLLEKKQKENEDKITEWSRKAELAVDKSQHDVARAAVERSLHYKQLTLSFAQQVADQKLQVDTLKNALNKLQHKLDKTRSQSDVLLAQHGRARGAETRSKSEVLLAQHGRARVVVGVNPGFSDFSLIFDSHLSHHQVRALLEALADYYRACGGVGFEIDFELEEYVREGAVASA